MSGFPLVMFRPNFFSEKRDVCAAMVWFQSTFIPPLHQTPRLVLCVVGRHGGGRPAGKRAEGGKQDELGAQFAQKGKTGPPAAQ